MGGRDLLKLRLTASRKFLFILCETFNRAKAALPVAVFADVVRARRHRSHSGSAAVLPGDRHHSPGRNIRASPWIRKRSLYEPGWRLRFLAAPARLRERRCGENQADCDSENTNE